MGAAFPVSYLLHDLDPVQIAEKRQRGRCIAWRCRRIAAKKKGGYCETCASRLFRMRNDDRYAYHNLKRSAAKRGIGFDLSFEDFAEFCAITGYLEMRGKEPHSLSIDRIKTDRPYAIGNLRILTYHDNVSHKYEQFADVCRARRHR